MENKKLYINLYGGCYLTDDEFKYIMKHCEEHHIEYDEKENGYRIIFNLESEKR